MEFDLTPKTLTNIRVFGVEAFGNEIKWTLDRPAAVCVTVSDEIMIADANNCVHVFDHRGGWLRTFGTPGDFTGKMQNLLQICANKTGEFVVVAMKGRQFKFQMYDANGNFSCEFGMKDAKSSHGIAIDKENRILSVDAGCKVVLFNKIGKKIYELKCCRVKSPSGIGVNDQELIFIGDRVNNCVQVYTYSGLFRYFIGGDTLTPGLIGLTVRGQEDILIAEIRQGKLCVSLFRQDGTWKSYSEAADRFVYGAALALLSNDNIVVTSRNNKAFIYEQTNKPRAPVQQGNLSQASIQAPYQRPPTQPDNIQACQPQLQSDGCQAPYQMQHFQPDNVPASHQTHLLPENFPASHQSHLLPENFPASHQSHLLPYNFPASHQSHLQPSNFPAPSQHQHIGPGGSRAFYQQQLFNQTIGTPSLDQHRGPDGSLTPSPFDQNPSSNLPVLYSNFHLPGTEQTPHQQNYPPLGSQASFLTQHLQPPHLQHNMGQIVSSHIQSRQPNSFVPTFNDQRFHELGLHRPVKFPAMNPNETLIHLQQQAMAGAPQQYLYNLPTVFAVPLRPNTVPLRPQTVSFPSRGINNNEQYSPIKWRQSQVQQAENRLIFEQHKQQYQQKEQEKDEQRMMSRFDRETAEISENLRTLSLPNDGGFVTTADIQQLELLDLNKGPLASSLQERVDLNESLDLRDHPLYSLSKMFAVQNPAPSTNLEEIPSRQYISHCGYIRDFQKPCAVAVDSEDNVIVVDAGDNRVVVYNKHGKILFSFGRAGSGAGQLVKPRKVAADPQTRSIVVLEDTSISQIKIFCKEGKFQYSFLSNCIDKPRAMTVSKKSEIAVVQFSDRHVVMHEMGGQLIRTVKCSNFKSPTGIAVGDYEFFISDSSDNCVKVYNFDGHLLHNVGNVHVTPSPIGVAIASNGHVAVVDTKTDFRITFFNPVGDYSAGYYSQKRHRNFEGFALTSTDDVVLICDDGKLWYYDSRRSHQANTFCPEKWLTSSPGK